MSRFLFFLFLLVSSSLAHGSATRLQQADSIYTSAGVTFGMPTGATANLTSAISADTLQNKTISGLTNTLSALPVAAQMVQDLFYGNGVATTLTLTASTSSTASTGLSCFQDGLLMELGNDYTYTNGSSTITLTSAMPTGTRVRCVYSKY